MEGFVIVVCEVSIVWLVLRLDIGARFRTSSPIKKSFAS